MLNDPAHTVLLGHDLHGRGPRGSLDLTQVRAHPPDPTAALVPHNNHPTPATPTKNPTLKHKLTQTVQLRPDNGGVVPTSWCRSGCSHLRRQMLLDGIPPEAEL